MRGSAGGFTLIELVAVIVILGVMAATAFPVFLDLGADANAAITANSDGNATVDLMISCAAGKAGNAAGSSANCTAY